MANNNTSRDHAVSERAVIDNNGATFSRRIPCEFAALASCSDTFDPRDIDSFLCHMTERHQMRRFPQQCVCWFCDERRFSGEGCYRARMAHVAMHYVLDPVLLPVRPDAGFLFHAHILGLINKETSKSGRLQPKTPPEKTIDRRARLLRQRRSGSRTQDRPLSIPVRSLSTEHKQAGNSDMARKIRRSLVSAPLKSRKRPREPDALRKTSSGSCSSFPKNLRQLTESEALRGIKQDRFLSFLRDSRRFADPRHGASMEMPFDVPDKNVLAKQNEVGSTSLNDIGNVPRRILKIDVGCDSDYEGSSHEDNDYRDTKHDDTETLYTVSTTASPLIIQHYVSELSHAIYRELRPQFVIQDWPKIYESLSELLKAFAIKIGTIGSSQVNRDIMFSVHNNHKDVVTRLEELLFNQDEQGSTYLRSNAPDGMSLSEKMRRWGMKSGMEATEDVNKGIARRMEDNSPSYSKAIANTEAFAWLIASIKRQSSFQWDAAHPPTMTCEIRRKILAKLHSRTIGTQWAPSSYTVAFQLPWKPLAARLEREYLRLLWTSEPKLRISDIFTWTSYSEPAYATRVGDYVERTWPSAGKVLLNVLQDVVDDHGKSSRSGKRMMWFLLDKTSLLTLKAIAPDATRISVQIRGPHLVVTVVGTAYSIAEYGEQLGWLASALRSSRYGSLMYSVPSIRDLDDRVPDLLAMQKPTGVQSSFDDTPVLKPSQRRHASPQPASETQARSDRVIRFKIEVQEDLESLDQARNKSWLRSLRPTYVKVVVRGYPIMRESQVPRGEPNYARPSIGEDIDNRSMEAMSAESASLQTGALSVSSDSASPDRLDCNGPSFQAFKRVLRSIVLRYHTETNGGAGSDNRGSTATTPQERQPERRLAPNLPRPSQRRKCRRDNSLDSGDDESELPPRKRYKPRQTNHIGKPKFLACPFWKLDPSTHWECFLKKNRTISHVKEHLHRRHTPTFYCQRCFRIFEDEFLHDTHVTDASCVRDPSARLGGISPNQSRQLSCKSKGTIEEQWYTMWQVLFSDQSRPSSIYVDSDQSPDFAMFREFSQRNGVAILQDELRVSGLLLRPGVPDGELQETLRRGLKSMFEYYRLDQGSLSAFSNPTPLSPLAGSSSPQPMQQDSSAEYNHANSGVVTGLRSSSTEPQTRDRIPPPQVLHGTSTAQQRTNETRQQAGMVHVLHESTYEPPTIGTETSMGYSALDWDVWNDTEFIMVPENLDELLGSFTTPGEMDGTVLRGIESRTESTRL